MAKAVGKTKCVAKGGPFGDEYLWLSGDTLEFVVRGYTGYYKPGTSWSRTTIVATWVDTKPKVQPLFQFESRENINGFSNGL